MKKIKSMFGRLGTLALLAATLVGTPACASRKAAATDSSKFVTVRDGKFFVNDKPYNFIGTNFWYGPILGSEGQGGDRKRLIAELDSLHAMGLDNLRILAGGEGDKSRAWTVSPSLQTAPGVYNDTLLAGLDFLVAEMEKRDMKAIIYLNNSWEWSGGYGVYLEWAGEGKSPLPNVDGYNTYCDYVAKFVKNEKAKSMALNHVKYMVGRTNRYTGKPYSQSPAIMSWQISNEPRPFSTEGKEAFAQWIDSTARLIKSIDPNHLVSTGSEGKYGCHVDINLWRRIHAMPSIDYANIHIWPSNWGWVKTETLTDSLHVANRKTRDYILEHIEAFKGVDKPIVLEEFGYPRDGKSFAKGSPVTARDKYYDFVLDFMGDGPGKVAGINFWGWGGLANPAHETWQAGDDYTGDPAQEPQGLFSIFADDASTIAIIKKHIKK